MMLRSGLSVVRRFRPVELSGARGLANGGLKKTGLHDRHVELKGKMVGFAGYSMPIQYFDGIRDSHLWCRASASVFDVSHMGQIRMSGKDRDQFLEKIVTADVLELPEGHAALSVFTTERGGIIDDTIITNLGDELGLVINAGCKDKDIEHITFHMNQAKKQGMDVDLKIIDDHELIALQGPKAMEVLSKLIEPSVDLTKMAFMTAKKAEVAGVPCLVTRCGYTGEDGFEISVPSGQAVKLWSTLCGNEMVKPAGLGARDTLRLEAGLCLYGSDIDTTVTPVEANITFVVGKGRRERGNYLGSDIINPQIKDKSLTTKKRCGMIVTGAPARGGEKVFDEDMNLIGQISSGTYSPSMSKPIAMGYLDKPFNKVGTNVTVNVRGKMQSAVVTKMPFVESRYYRVE